MSLLVVDRPQHPALPAASRDGGESSEMVLVSCVIRPERLDAVRDALDGLHVIGGMTVTDVRGFGRQKGQVEHYRGGEYTLRFINKVKLEIVVKTHDVDRVLGAAKAAAQTGQVGDGKAFVFEVSQAVRIRTGEQGDQAL